MKKSKLIALLMAMALVFGCFAGCSVAGEEEAADPTPAPAESSGDDASGDDAEASADDKIILGFSLFDNTQPWAVAYTNSVFAEAEERGYEYVYADAQNDPAKQVSDVEDLLAQDIDYLILAPIEFEAGAACLDAAKKAGVPTLLWSRIANGEPGVDYITSCTGDFVWEGTSAAEWLIENRDGTAKVVEIAGTVGADAATGRQEGFAAAIADTPGIEIVASQPANFVRADAQKVMENLIQSLGTDGFDTVYAHSDEMAIGAVMAMRAAGIEPGVDVTVISVDGQKEAVQMIKDGGINCVITCSPIYNTTPFDVLEQVIAGEEVPTWVANPGTVIDSTNIDEELPKAF